MVKMQLYTDGASRGNPGKAAYGFVLVNSLGQVLHEEGKTIGNTTNNVAEYTALLKGLEQARIFGASSIECFSDSQLLVRQLSGEYKVKQEHLRVFYDEIKKLERSFDTVTYSWVKRNTGHVERADALCNRALDGQL